MLILTVKVENVYCFSSKRSMFLSTANHFWGFPGDPVGKSPPCNARARSLVWEEPAGPGGARSLCARSPQSRRSHRTETLALQSESGPPVATRGGWQAATKAQCRQEVNSILKELNASEILP